MKTLRLTTLLYLGLFLGFVTMASFLGYAIWQQNQLLDITQKLYNHPFTVSNATKDLKINVQDIWETTEQIIHHQSNNEKMLSQWYSSRGNVRAHLNIIKERFLGTPQDIADIERTYKIFDSFLVDAIKIAQTQGEKKAQAFLEERKVSVIYQELNKEISDVINFAMTKAKQFNVDNHEKLHQSIAYQGYMLGAVITGGLFIALLLMKRLRKEFHEIHTTIEGVKKRNYSLISFKTHEFKEFSYVKQTLNEMVHEISASEQTISEQNEELIALNESLMDEAKRLEEAYTEIDASNEELRQVNEVLNQRTHELQENEEILTNSKNQLKNLLEQSPIAVRIAKKEGQEVIFANYAYCTLINKNSFEQSAVGENPKKYYANPDDYIQILNKLQSGEEITNLMVELQIPNVGTKWALASYRKIVFDEQEAILGWFYDVTNNEENKQKLEQTTHDLQKIFNEQEALLKVQTTGFVHLKDRHFLWTNEIFDKMLGYNPGELQGQSTRVMYYDDEEYTNYGKDGYKALSEKGLFTREIKAIKKDGTPIWLLAGMTAIKQENNETNNEAVGIAIDITEIKQLNETLNNEKRRFKTIMELSSDGIHIIDTKGNMIQFSDSFAKMLGYSRNEMALLNVADWDCFIPQSEIETTIHLLIESPRIFETQHQRKDGSTYDVEISAKGIVLEGKSYLYASARDVSEKKRHDKLLLAQKKEFETIFRGSIDGIAIVDLETNFLDFNDAYIKFTGLTRKELLQSSCINLSIPEDKERAKEAVKKAIQEGYVQNFEKSCLINNRLISVNMSLTLLPDKKRLLIVSKDITDKKIYEKKLKELNSTLQNKVEEETHKRLENERMLIQQSKMAMMGEMMGAIAHQWRQPLNALGVIIQDVEDAYKYDEMNEEYIQRMIQKSMNNITFMSKTIDDFRNFFKIDKEKVSFDLICTINSVLEIFKGQFIAHNIATNLFCYAHDCDVDCPLKSGKALIRECKKETIIVKSLESELKQVLLNLVSNAHYVLNDKEITDKAITIHLIEESNDIRIIVWDNGGGIPEEIIDRVFEPYFSTKGTKGTGIGLYMSKMIIENNINGTISVCNNEEGAEFTIIIPKNFES